MGVNFFEEALLFFEVDFVDMATPVLSLIVYFYTEYNPNRKSDNVMKITSDDLSNVKNWLTEGDFASILELAGRRKRTLSLLTALTYDPDALISDRAIEATGQAAKQIAEQDPEFVRNYILRLFWLVNEESGGVCWRAPELIEKILIACPQFNHFQPMLMSLHNSDEM